MKRWNIVICPYMPIQQAKYHNRMCISFFSDKSSCLLCTSCDNFMCTHHTIVHTWHPTSMQRKLLNTWPQNISHLYKTCYLKLNKRQCTQTLPLYVLIPRSVLEAGWERSNLIIRTCPNNYWHTESCNWHCLQHVFSITNRCMSAIPTKLLLYRHEPLNISTTVWDGL